MIYITALVWSLFGPFPKLYPELRSSSGMTLLPMLTGLPISLGMNSSLLGVPFNVLQQLVLPTSTFNCPHSLQPPFSSHSKCPIYLTPHSRLSRVVTGLVAGTSVSNKRNSMC